MEDLRKDYTGPERPHKKETYSAAIVTAKLLKSQDGNLFFRRVKTGRSGTWSLVE